MTTGAHELHQDERGQWERYCCGRLESADGAAIFAGDAFAGHVRVADDAELPPAVDQYLRTL